ncbi:MAG: DUF3460 family protein [Limnobacter sp.]|nr:DUF3460 family protein [Limnobacter sp.]
MALYKSDITKFIEELRERKPDLEYRQREGRSLLWDRPQDPEFAREAKEAKVPQTPYVYYQHVD